MSKSTVDLCAATWETLAMCRVSRTKDTKAKPRVYHVCNELKGNPHSHHMCSCTRSTLNKAFK